MLPPWNSHHHDPFHKPCGENQWAWFCRIGQEGLLLEHQSTALMVAHTWYRIQGRVVNWGIKHICQVSSWCRPNSKYHSYSILNSKFWRDMVQKPRALSWMENPTENCGTAQELSGLQRQLYASTTSILKLRWVELCKRFGEVARRSSWAIELLALWHSNNNTKWLRPGGSDVFNSKKSQNWNKTVHVSFRAFQLFFLI